MKNYAQHLYKSQPTAQSLVSLNDIIQAVFCRSLHNTITGENF